VGEKKDLVLITKGTNDREKRGTKNKSGGDHREERTTGGENVKKKKRGPVWVCFYGKDKQKAKHGGVFLFCGKRARQKEKKQTKARHPKKQRVLVGHNKKGKTKFKKPI